MRFTALLSILLLATVSSSQNDLDAIRYSRIGANGTSRFISMGGAFGALGADLSCAAYNPAGLGLYRKGDISFGGGLRFTRNTGSIYGSPGSVTDANFVYNNFGIATSLENKNDPESRHVIAFTNLQLLNFNEKTTLSGYTNKSSIAQDMLYIANKKGNPDNLNSSYEYMGFYTYVLDTFQGKYFSYVDLGRTVKQRRDIVTGGRMNELNFSYAYSHKDDYYIGASIGLPRISYTSTTTHFEVDDKDSMRIFKTGTNTYTNNYIVAPPGNSVETDKLGFNSLTYQEYFSTTGRGINLKIGGVARVTDYFRFGMYYHTASILNLTDRYLNKMTASFDYDPKKTLEITDPPEGGYYSYRIITPSRLGFNTAFIIAKRASLAVDYELVNYRRASLSAESISVFEGVNAVINTKYKTGSNLRIGGEYNLNPMMIRAGYNMMGSPFGNSFTGSFVRHTVSVGAGFRTKSNLYFDFVWFRSFTNEDYYMFSTIPQRAELDLRNSQLAATVGIKF
jgi:hypothetical protein